MHPGNFEVSSSSSIVLDKVVELRWTGTDWTWESEGKRLRMKYGSIGEVEYLDAVGHNGDTEERFRVYIGKRLS